MPVFTAIMHQWQKVIDHVLCHLPTNKTNKGYFSFQDGNIILGTLLIKRKGNGPIIDDVQFERFGHRNKVVVQ